MKITVIGGGNIGLVLVATLCANTDDSIYLYTSGSKNIKRLIRFRNYDTKKEMKVTNFTVTNDIEIALKDANILLCTYPAFLRQKFIEKNGDLIDSKAIFGFIPGYGGIEFSCKKLLKKGVTIFGLQRVPFVARATVSENEIVANMLSKKRELFVAALPKKRTNNICNILENLLHIDCIPLKEYLSVTLTPSNPLLHTVGLFNVFKNSNSDSVFEKELRFYHEWNDKASELLLKYDEEVQNICRALEPLDLHEVVSLAEYYEAPTPKEMTNKLKSIPAFEEVMVPLKHIDYGYVPDLQSRMFVEDFPYGVCIIKDFALITGVDTPTINRILAFYTKIAGYDYFNSDGTHGKDYIKTGAPGNFGLKTKDDIINFYHGGK